MAVAALDQMNLRKAFKPVEKEDLNENAESRYIGFRPRSKPARWEPDVIKLGALDRLLELLESSPVVDSKGNGFVERVVQSFEGSS